MGGGLRFLLKGHFNSSLCDSLQSFFAGNSLFKRQHETQIRNVFLNETDYPGGPGLSVRVWLRLQTFSQTNTLIRMVWKSLRPVIWRSRHLREGEEYSVSRSITATPANHGLLWAHACRSGRIALSSICPRKCGRSLSLATAWKDAVGLAGFTCLWCRLVGTLSCDTELGSPDWWESAMIKLGRKSWEGHDKKKKRKNQQCTFQCLSFFRQLTVKVRWNVTICLQTEWRRVLLTVKITLQI